MTSSPASVSAAPGGPSGREMRADPFHTGVRLVSLVLWLAAIAAVYLLGRLILGLVVGPLTTGHVVVLALVALLSAQPLAVWGEKFMLRHWSSGRSVQLQAGALTMCEKSGRMRLDLSQKVNYWRWRFEIRNRRGGRVPDGHFCHAIRLVQDDAAVSLYVFLSPKQSAAVGARYPFYELRRPRDTGKAPLGGREAVYLAAEDARWNFGAELQPADFDLLLAHLAVHVPEFSAGPNS